MILPVHPDRFRIGVLYDTHRPDAAQPIYRRVPLFRPPIRWVILLDRRWLGGGDPDMAEMEWRVLTDSPSIHWVATALLRGRLWEP